MKHWIKSLLKKIIHPVIRRKIRRIQSLFLTFIKNIYYRIFRQLDVSRFKSGHLLVNIGCGACVNEGWVNVDMEPARGVFFLDVRKKLPFKDAQVRHIHCEHILEHIEYPAAVVFLIECHRVLQPHGTLRLILPDAEKYFQAYCRRDALFFEKLKNLGGTVDAFRTRIEIINQMFRMGGDHRFAWDFETLELNLKASGFVDIQRSQFGEIQQELNIDATDEWRKVESLYVVAVKPDHCSG